MYNYVYNVPVVLKGLSHQIWKANKGGFSMYIRANLNCKRGIICTLKINEISYNCKNWKFETGMSTKSFLNSFLHSAQRKRNETKLNGTNLQIFSKFCKKQNQDIRYPVGFFNEKKISCYFTFKINPWSCFK